MLFLKQTASPVIFQRILIFKYFEMYTKISYLYILNIKSF